MLLVQGRPGQPQLGLLMFVGVVLGADRRGAGYHANSAPSSERVQEGDKEGNTPTSVVVRKVSPKIASLLSSFLLYAFGESARSLARNIEKRKCAACHGVVVSECTAPSLN